MDKFITDITVIGAGPTGLFSIFEAGMLKMRCHVVDTLDFIGGQCNALYPEKPIYDIPAHPEISAADLITNLEKQAEPFEPVYHLGQQVMAISKNGSEFTVKTSKGTEITSKAIIIAAGCGAFGPNRPPLENIEEYENKSVFYMVGKKSEFAGKKIAIAGGGDSAADWAISLADIAERIYMIHRRPKFRCAPDSLDKINALVDAGKMELVVPYQLDSLEGSNGQLEKVIVKTLDGDKKDLDANVLLPFFGLAMELGPISEWGLNLDKNHISVDPSTMESSEKGIFAVGDIINYPGKLKLILNGFAEAATACHSIYPLVYPDQELHFEYSTTSGVPAA